jgi:hypothetical protein
MLAQAKAQSRYEKQTKSKRSRDVVKVVKCFPSKCNALSLISNTAKKYFGSQTTQ